MMFTMTERRPTHPGAILKHDVMEPLGISVTKAAELLGVSRKTVSNLVNEKIPMSPEMAMRIAKATNTSVDIWLKLQLKLTLWELGQHEPENVQPKSMVG